MAAGLKNVECPQVATAIIGVRKTGLGTPVLSGLNADVCSVVDNGVGDYTIIVSDKRPFNLGCIAQATLHTSGVVTIDVANSSKLQIRLKCFAVDGTTAAEKDFDLIVLGTHALDYNS